jgi:hypothetical protein
MKNIFPSAMPRTAHQFPKSVWTGGGHMDHADLSSAISLLEPLTVRELDVPRLIELLMRAIYSRAAPEAAGQQPERAVERGARLDPDVVVATFLQEENS